MRKLAVLEERARELETCGYCPKLCRASCPVSDVEASEALIPWGKMSLTWYQARGDLESNRETAKLAWGCTGCRACRDACEHRNEVAPTLEEARAVHRAKGLAPKGSERALSAFENRRAACRRRAAELGSPSGEVVLLVGCGYLANEPKAASDAVRVARALLGDAAVATGCCGLVPRLAGDVERAARERAALEAELGGRPLYVADAGCALELRDRGATTLIELAAERVDRLGTVGPDAERYRYHDACRLSRGLGLGKEPRRVLEAVLGRPPEEFDEHVCSGAGGLLPFTFGRAARRIRAQRLEEHRRLGGGTVVTGCSASLGWFRRAGGPVLDLVTLLARSVPGD